MKKKIMLLLISSAAIHAQGDVKTIVLKKEAINFSHLEPLTCSSYNELIERQNKKGFYCLIARVVSRGTNSYHTHYVEAGQFNRLLFNGALLPTERQHAAFLLNPLNNKPITEPIQYLIFDKRGGIYVCSQEDLRAENAQGQFLKSLLHAHYALDESQQAAAYLELAAYYEQPAVNNKSKAVHWYKKAAANMNNGRVQAQAWLALADYARTTGQIHDMMRYYQQTAEQKADGALAAHALLRLAEVYRLGADMPRNTRLALHYYERATQAKVPAVTALALIGQAELYRMGDATIKKNFEHAVALYEKAQQYEQTPAMKTVIAHGLADMYHTGGFGIMADYVKAAHCYTQAAHQTENKTIQAIACTQLGDLYRLGGHGLQAHAQHAHDWYKKVANEAAHESSWYKAQYGLARLYSQPNGPLYNVAQAQKLYEQLIAVPSCVYGQACNGLAHLYTQSLVVEDHKTAISLFNKAVASNDPQAQAVAHKELAELYRRGTGVKKDLTQALAHYTKACEQCVDMQVSMQARESLAEIYRLGEGDIQKDLSKAIDYYTELKQQTSNSTLHARANKALDEIKQTTMSMTSKVDKALKSPVKSVH